MFSLFLYLCYYTSCLYSILKLRLRNIIVAPMNLIFQTVSSNNELRNSHGESYLLKVRLLELEKVKISPYERWQIGLQLTNLVSCLLALYL